MLPQIHQSIPHLGLLSVHPFTAPSGIRKALVLNNFFFSPSTFKSLTICFIFAAYVILAGLNGSLLYSWRPDTELFTMVLRVPAARSFLSFRVPSLNTTKVLLASTEEDSSSVYQLSAVSNQSDFIPR